MIRRFRSRPSVSGSGLHSREASEAASVRKTSARARCYTVDLFNRFSSRMSETERNPADILVLEGGLSVAEAARRTGVSYSTMYRWYRLAKSGKTAVRRGSPRADTAESTDPTEKRVLRRRVCFDTETTGLSWRMGDRVVEVGAVELDEELKPVRRFQAYLNPERSVPWSAYRVHGLSTEFLSDKPLFSDVADDFLAFVSGAELIAHNAAFDHGFLNMELSRAGRPTLDDAGCTVTCTLRMARRLFPKRPNSLDALCQRLGVSAAGREVHGALRDSEILCDVYRSLMHLDV